MFLNLVGQISDVSPYLLPMLCCLLVMIPSLFRRGGESEPGRTTEHDLWFTTQPIEEAYAAIEKETTEWRREAEAMEAKPRSSLTKLRDTLSRQRRGDRYIVEDTVHPTLLKLNDRAVGPLYFELTEVEGGGTVVKATHSSSIKDRVVKFKAQLPLKIPVAPVGYSCPTCGKSVMREFNICPYCGQKLITE